MSDHVRTKGVGVAMLTTSKQGMHRHFRMVALAQHLRSHGHREAHTRIPGIWKKLESLYNLEALNERVSNLQKLVSDTAEPRAGGCFG